MACRCMHSAMPIYAADTTIIRADVEERMSGGIQAWRKEGSGRVPTTLSTAKVSGNGVRRVKGIDNSNTKQRQAMCHLKGAMNLHERHNTLNEELRLSARWS